MDILKKKKKKKKKNHDYHVGDVFVITTQLWMVIANNDDAKDLC